MTPRTHRHPNPLLNRIIETGALVITLVMLAGALLILVLPFMGAPRGLLLAPVLIALLAAPVLMLTAYAPEVTVDEAGITLHPVVWKDRHIRWEEIEAVRLYPLLPTSDQEVTRRYFVGQRNYRPAEGILLVIPSLPLQYRIVDFFAGDRARPRPAIALTNRAHAAYDDLYEIVLRMTDPAIHDETLLA